MTLAERATARFRIEAWVRPNGEVDEVRPNGEVDETLDHYLGWVTWESLHEILDQVPQSRAIIKEQRTGQYMHTTRALTKTGRNGYRLQRQRWDDYDQIVAFVVLTT